MQEDFHLIFVVVIGTFLLMMLVALIVVSVLFYRRSQRRNSKAMEDLKNSFQKEILLAELEIKENTLNTIAQEIHDNIGQVLSLAKLNLSKVLIADSAQDSDKVNVTKNLIGKAIQDLRNLSKTLNTSYIGDHSLSQLVDMDIDLIEKAGDYKIFAHLSGDEKQLASQDQVIIYRIIQEAFNNIIKHAQGNQIDVWLKYFPDSFQLVIKDNGVGFDHDAVIESHQNRKGSGLYNMENRTRLMGGTFACESRPGGGTILTVDLPLNSAR